MTFFESISKKVTDTAKAAARKSGDIVEVTKLNLNIAAEEDKIKRKYMEIGKAVYETYANREEIPHSFKVLCEKVKEYEKNIEEMKTKILQLKGLKNCPSCGAELDEDFAFCPKCGAEQEEPVETSESEDSEEAEESDEDKECTCDQAEE